MGYMTANQASKKWNISQRRVQILCSENRIKGTFKLGEAWAIPENAEKPEDNRKVKKQNENIRSCNKVLTLTYEESIINL